MTSPDSRKISRLFRQRSDGGVLHLRTAGPATDAPVLLALHESPRSSASLVPLLRHAGAQIRILAPDTPGFGHSDRLRTSAGLSDYANTMIDLLDGLGLTKVAVYGTHTGAVIACELARAHPDRIAHLLLDGLPVFSPEEKRIFSDGYFAPYEPVWDGSHVMQLWSRLLDQQHWFPWHEKKSATWLGTSYPQLSKLQETAVGQLLAGPKYDEAYKLAVSYDTKAALDRIAVGSSAFARRDDLLHPHLARLDDAIEHRSFDRGLAEWAAHIIDIVQNSAGDLAAGPVSNATSKAFIDIDGAHIFAARSLASEPETEARLPEFPFDAAWSADKAEGGWVIDPPGYGMSEACPARDGEELKVVAEAAEELGCKLRKHDALNPAASRLLEEAPLPMPALDGRHLMAGWFAARNALTDPQSAAPPALTNVEALFRTLVLSFDHRRVLGAMGDLYQPDFTHA